MNDGGNGERLLNIIIQTIKLCHSYSQWKEVLTLPPFPAHQQPSGFGQKHPVCLFLCLSLSTKTTRNNP